MATLSSVIGRGVVASRPAAGTTGQLYYATDVSGGQLQRDNGSTWDSIEFGGASGAVTQITKTVLGSPAASIVFSSIASTYNALQIVISQARNSTAADVPTSVQFNTDTGTNYQWQEHYGLNTASTAAAAVGATAIPVGDVPGTGVAAGYAASMVIDIPNYASSTFYKQTLSRCFSPTSSAAAGMFLEHIGGQWLSTAAIATVTLLPSSGNFTTGTTAILYGIT
jgi:hypothetical protein